MYPMYLLQVQVTFQTTKAHVCSSSTEYLTQPRPLHHDAQTNSETTNKRSYDTPRFTCEKPGSSGFVRS